MEIRQYLNVLRRRKWLIVLTALMTILTVGVGTFRMTPVYSASTIVRIAQIQDRSIEYSDLNYSVRLLNTYSHILRSRPVLEEVIQRLDLKTWAGDLAHRVEVEVVADTELLKITSESTDPRQAMAIADTLAAIPTEQGQRVYSGHGKTAREILEEQLIMVQEELTEDRALLQGMVTDSTQQDQAVVAIQDANTRIRTLEQTYARLLDEYEKARVGEAMRENSISIVEPAGIPKSPSRPRPILNIALGALVGLAGGAGLALWFENLDRTIHSVDDLEGATKASVLGSIPRFAIPRGSQHGVILVDGDRRSLAGEMFRALRSNILSSACGTPPRTLLITSAEPGAGKSTVLANLAVAIAQAGQKTVVVDSDLIHPCLHQAFGLPNQVGLGAVIGDPSIIDTVLQGTGIQGVRVLPSGLLPPNHVGELIGSSKMQGLIQELAQEADVVLLDSSPTLATADAAMLAPLVDGILLVAAKDQATGRSVQRALQQLERVGGTVLGIVFNKAKAEIGDYTLNHK